MRSKIYITEREYEYMKEDRDNLISYGKFLANKAFPIAGYGFYGARILEDSNKNEPSSNYAFEWEHERSCD